MNVQNVIIIFDSMMIIISYVVKIFKSFLILERRILSINFLRYLKIYSKIEKKKKSCQKVFE